MRRLRSILAALGGLAACPAAVAQLALPGAVPQSSPSVVAPPAGASVARPRGTGAAVSAPILKAPGEEAVAGRQFQRNGATGLMAIDRSASGLTISKLAFAGYQLSRPTEACRVEVDGPPIALQPAPRHDGLLSYDVALAACPFSLDVMEGAARVRGGSCDFVAADCRVDPSGVWGPSGGAIGPAEAKTIERSRARAEMDARAAYRALIAAHKGDRAGVREIARSQASFSSSREELCRDYVQEDRHGFCSARVTMAHALALSAELRGSGETPRATPRAKRPPRPRAAAAPNAVAQ